MSQLKQEQVLLLVLIFIILVVGVGLLIWQNFNNQAIIANLNEPPIDYQSQIPPIREVETRDTEKDVQPKTIIIHIAGEVQKSGVYELPEDSRVIDALKAAGGETNEADLNLVNLAAPIYDGDKIYIPAREEVKQQTGAVSPNSEQFITGQGTGKININKATIEELQQLSGIGSSKAKSIIEYREKIGGFTDLKQLLDVPGIGERILEKIKNELTLR